MILTRSSKRLLVLILCIWPLGIVVASNDYTDNFYLHTNLGLPTRHPRPRTYSYNPLETYAMNDQVDTSVGPITRTRVRRRMRSRSRTRPGASSSGISTPDVEISYAGLRAIPLASSLTPHSQNYESSTTHLDIKKVPNKNRDMYGSWYFNIKAIKVSSTFNTESAGYCSQGKSKKCQYYDVIVPNGILGMDVKKDIYLQSPKFFHGKASFKIVPTTSGKYLLQTMCSFEKCYVTIRHDHRVVLGKNLDDVLPLNFHLNQIIPDENKRFVVSKHHHHHFRKHLYYKSVKSLGKHSNWHEVLLHVKPDKCRNLALNTPLGEIMGKMYHKLPSESTNQPPRELYTARATYRKKSLEDITMVCAPPSYGDSERCTLRSRTRDFPVPPPPIPISKFADEFSEDYTPESPLPTHTSSRSPSPTHISSISSTSSHERSPPQTHAHTLIHPASLVTNIVHFQEWVSRRLQRLFRDSL